MISHKMNGFAALVLGSSLLAGCGILKKKQPDPEASATSTPLVAPTPPPVAPTPAVAAPEPPVTVADESVPAPEDFEDEAFEKVSDKTYKGELAGLKKELEAK
jgi:hypothetical protein